MWITLIGILGKLLDFFLPSQSKEKVARDDGRAAGVSEQQAVDQGQALKDVHDAKLAADAVDADVARGVPITRSDGFRRD